jgi:hypothetical protein
MMRLCLYLGVAHPDALLDVLTSRQLADWIAFSAIEPWGTPADDFRASMMTWGGVLGKTGRKAFAPHSFLPQWGPPDPVDPASYKMKAKAHYARIAESKRLN